MKTLIATSAFALALSSSIAVAEPFEFEKAWASPELDFSQTVIGYKAPADLMSSDIEISLFETNRGNPEIDFGHSDDAAPVEVASDVEPTSLEVLTKGNIEYPYNV